MKSRNFILKIHKTSFIAFFLFFTLQIISNASIQLELMPWSQMRLEGKSPYHAYFSNVTDIQLNTEVAPSKKEEALGVDIFSQKFKVGKLIRFELVIPIVALNSGNAELDETMRLALREKEYPEIRFSLKDYEILESVQSRVYPARLHGVLFVAGKEKSMTLKVFLIFQPNSIHIYGDQELFMTDFGISPPPVPFQKHTTNEKVVIHYQLFLKLVNK